MGNAFLAQKLNYLTAKDLIGKTIKIIRLPTELRAGIDEVIVVDNIDPGGTDDDTETDVAFWINRGIRVWKDDDKMTIEILS